MSSSNFKKVQTRIQNKHDLEVNWDRASFIPLAGELIIYDIEVDSTGNTLSLPAGRTIPYTYERFKIGDGIRAINDLPFAGIKAGNNVNIAADGTISVPSATSSTAGLIKVSSVNNSAVTVNDESTEAGRYYPIELNNDGKAIVNVPWTDNNTVYTHPAPTKKNTSSLVKIAVDSTGHVTDTVDVTKDDITALGIPGQDTQYTHPTHTAANEGLYKVTVNNLGHVTGTTAVTKTDITNLGIPGQDTTYTHPNYTAHTGKPTANQTPAFGGTATVSQVTSDATGHVTNMTDRTITIPNTMSNGTSTAGLIKTTSTVNSNSGYTACPVIEGVPYYKDTNTTYTHPSTHEASIIKYTNATPTVSSIGGVPVGTIFEGATIQDVLDMILYPYVDIVVNSPSVTPEAGKYYVHELPTLSEVSIYVKKNSATNLSFKLVDGSDQIGSTLTEANIDSNNRLTFSGLDYTIDTTRTLKIEYTYKGKGGDNSDDKAIDIGTFIISFQDPSKPTITSNLDRTHYYNGETASVTEVIASMSSLGSATATGGITKVELYKDGTRVKYADNPILPYEFSVSDSLTNTSGSKTTNYKVKAYYNTRTGSSTTTSETSVESYNLTVSFSHKNAEIRLTGLNDASYSKLDPQSISGIGASFKKHSDKITSVKLLASDSADEEEVVFDTGSNPNIDGYDKTPVTTSFNDYSETKCSTVSLTAKAYNGSIEVASDTKTLTFYAPYCYGWVSPDVTYDNITRATLEALEQKTYSETAPNLVSLTEPAGQRKLVYAIPNGTYTKVIDNNTGFDMTSSFTKGTKDITFVDNSTQSYQIFILTKAAQAPAELKFS